MKRDEDGGEGGRGGGRRYLVDKNVNDLRDGNGVIREDRRLLPVL